MNKGKRNERLFKGGLISEAALRKLDEKLAREIILNRAVKMHRINDMKLEVELLRNGLAFL